MTSIRENWERMQQHEKPPLGVMPEHLWREARARDLVRAIHKRLEHGMTERLATLVGWIDELKEHFEWLKANPPAPTAEELLRSAFPPTSRVKDDL